jgi:hypothetical protein
MTRSLSAVLLVAVLLVSPASALAKKKKGKKTASSTAAAAAAAPAASTTPDAAAGSPAAGAAGTPGTATAPVAPALADEAQVAPLGSPEPMLEGIARPSPFDATRPNVAVMRLKVDPELPAALGPNIEDAVLRALSAYRGIKVIGYSDVVSMLESEAQKQLLGCDGESCLAEIVGALGAAVIVDGNVGKLGSSWVVNLKMVDASVATVLGRGSVTTAADGARLAAAVPEAVTSLLQGAAISKSPRGTALGTAVGWQPVGSGRRAAPWVATGIAGAVFAVGGVFALQASSEASKARSAFAGTAAWRDARDASHSKALLSNYVFAGGAAVGIVAGALFWWNRDVDRGVITGVAATPGGARASISVPW